VSFDVVASFLGRRNYNRFEMADAFGNALAARTGARYLARTATTRPSGAALSFRIHLVEDRATIAVRLGPDTLHRRPYKHRSRPGTLHPPLARAMALVGGAEVAEALVDPFCGAGTICIEAAQVNPSADVTGFDLDPDAIAVAGEHAERAGVRIRLERADAGVLPVEAGAAGAVVTNPPWDRVVEARGSAAGGLEAAAREWLRVTAADGRVVVLAPQGADVEGLVGGSLALTLRQPVSLAGQHVDLVAFGAAGTRWPFGSGPIGRALASGASRTR
jgi:23S rRNA G2445 N2-methylase RlmL